MGGARTPMGAGARAAPPARLRRGGAAASRGAPPPRRGPGEAPPRRRAHRAVRAGAAGVSATEGISRLFGLDVETAPPAELLRKILSFADHGEHRRVTYVNAHVLNQSFQNPELRHALETS